MDCEIRFALAADKISRTARCLYADRYFDDTFNVGDGQISKQAYNGALDKRLGPCLGLMENHLDRADPVRCSLA